MAAHLYDSIGCVPECVVGVDEYLDGAPEGHRSTLLVRRSNLRELLPDATEALSYGMPDFVMDGKLSPGTHG